MSISNPFCWNYPGQQYEKSGKGSRMPPVSGKCCAKIKKNANGKTATFSFNII